MFLLRHPSFWKTLLLTHYRFNNSFKTTQIENYNKKLFLGRRFMTHFLPSVKESESQLVRMLDLVERASNPELLKEYIDAALDMAVHTSESFSAQSQSVKSRSSYLMLSVFPSEQKIVLWKFKGTLLSHNNITPDIVTVLGFEAHDLHPRYAKFLGRELYYTQLKQIS